MSKKPYIVLLISAAFFAACSTANSIPIDDAYYSPQVESPASATATPSSSSSQSSASSASSASSPSIEYLNVQDTTVTIRIKK